MRFSIILFMLLLLPITTAIAERSVCSDLNQRIHAGQKWIVNAQLPNHLFTYEYRPLENRFTDDDNIVRQLGTFWVLIESLKKHHNKDSLNAIEKFRKKISTFIVRSKAKNDDIAYIQFNDVGKVNSSALYVLSLMSLKKNNIPLTEQEKTDLPLFAKGLREMSDQSGGFWYLYYVEKENNIITSYGSGEALYALAEYYRNINDLEGLKWVYNEFNKYFNRFLKNQDNFSATEYRGFLSWGIYALAALNEKHPIQYENTIKPMLDTVFNYRAKNPECRKRGCILKQNLGDAPFFEGMVQAYKMAIAHNRPAEDVQKIRNYLTLTRDEYKRLQILDIQKFTEDYGFAGEKDPVLGAFCWDKNCQQIRNDLNQHAISAFIYYHDAFCSL